MSDAVTLVILIILTLVWLAAASYQIGYSYFHNEKIKLLITVAIVFFVIYHAIIGVVNSKLLVTIKQILN